MPKSNRSESYKRAQAVTTLVINGQLYERIRFESEQTDDKNEYRGEWLCGHCDVSDFSYHLLGCEAERCPRCGRQVISCPCDFQQRPGTPPLV